MKIRDRIKELRRVKASELIPNPKNWRTHPIAQQDALKGILAEVGFAGAVLARELDDGSLMLIDGHMRAETTNDQEIPVLILDVDEAESDKLLATFDPIAAMAESDPHALDALLRNVDTGSEALQKMLAELADGAGLYQDKEVLEDEVPEPPADPITKPGDLWVLGDHRVQCGDSTKAEDVGRLMGGQKINVAFTSPPYASQRKYDESSGFKPIAPEDFVKWFEPIAANVKRWLSTDGSWFVNIKEHCENGQRSLYVKDLVTEHVRKWSWMFVDEFCWKRPGMPMSQPNRFKNSWEPVFHFATGKLKFRPESVTQKKNTAWKGDGGVNHKEHRDGKGVKGNSFVGDVWASNVLEIAGVESGIQHNAMFPIGLPSFFIKAFTDDNDIIYDPFLGSGTTLIAADQLGRKCYGMEISPAYCDVIVQRWEKLTGKTATLEVKNG